MISQKSIGGIGGWDQDGRFRTKLLRAVFPTKKYCELYFPQKSIGGIGGWDQDGRFRTKLLWTVFLTKRQEVGNR